MRTGLATKTIAAASLSVVNVDTTVQDKAVAFPTDARLLNKARIAVVKLATQCGITLRQPYTFKGPKKPLRSLPATPTPASSTEPPRKPRNFALDLELDLPRFHEQFRNF